MRYPLILAFFAGAGWLAILWQRGGLDFTATVSGGILALCVLASIAEELGRRERYRIKRRRR